MADQIVGFKIQVNGQEKVVKSLGEMKQLIKEANFELLSAQKNFGEYSKEAVNAAKKVASLKDSLQEAGETAQLFDPGKKFQAFAGALSAVGGSVSAFQGALGLIGAESQNVEKALLKVQSALALSQGLSTVADSVKDFQRLAAVIQSTTIFQKAYNIATIAATAIQRAFGIAVVTTSTAFKALRGAILATGIGALVVGIGILVTKIIDWTNATKKSEEALKKQAEATKIVNQGIDSEIALLTALGNQEELIAQKRKEQVNNNLKDLRDRLTKVKGLTEEEKSEFRKLNTELQIIDIQESNRKKKVAEDAAKQRQEETKKIVDDTNERNKLVADANKTAVEKAKQIANDIFLSEITDANEREQVKISLQYEADRKEIENSLATEAEKNLALTTLKEQYRLQSEELNSIRSAEELDKVTTKLSAEVEAEQFAADAKIAISANEVDELIKQLERETEAEDKQAKANVQISELESKAKIDNAQKVANILTGLSDIFGKETAAGKATAIAAATINTYLAASQALTGIKKLNPFGATIAIAQAALIVANGIKQVREIAKVKVPGGGGTASVPASTLSTAAPISPTAPLVNTRTILDQTSIQQLGSATNRAYVLETDVTNSQERIRRINRAARLG